ncbi:hypothetical protein BD626DRAFT_513155 [Schizophyllum amplum]|uniref:RING-type domain-containing protein n=1 Tax=Schizophyllum amplum TaxID=97359 RepID=A0A550BZ91_9AGAR|nr:hypothetical protein BD626DRAFT_513155 [Auriculariopsis ampla]
MASAHCCICLVGHPIEDMCILPCNHTLGRECAARVSLNDEFKQECPLCRQPHDPLSGRPMYVDIKMPGESPNEGHGSESDRHLQSAGGFLPLIKGKICDHRVERALKDRKTALAERDTAIEAFKRMRTALEQEKVSCAKLDYELDKVRRQLGDAQACLAIHPAFDTRHPLSRYDRGKTYSMSHGTSSSANCAALSPAHAGAPRAGRSQTSPVYPATAPVYSARAPPRGP